MKKKWVTLIAFIVAVSAIILSFSLTGCDEELDPDDKPGDSESADKSEGEEPSGQPGDSESTDKPGDAESADKPQESLTFEEFLKMTPAEQEAYMNSYEDITDFLEWYRIAEEKYKEEQPGIEIGGDGDIDIGDFIN